MNKRARKVITVLFAIVFLASAPTLVLFTMGYRYNWKKHKVEKTGILTVTTRPAGAAISIDGSPTGHATPYSFTRLLPEDYAIRLTKTGYLPWEKTLTVRSGQTTFARPVTLFRDALPRLASEARVDRIAFSPDGTRATFLAEGDEWTELRELDLASSSPTILSRFATNAYEDLTFSWAPDGSAILFTGTDADGAFTATAYDMVGDHEPRSLLDIPPKPPLSVRWAGTGERLLADTTAGLYAFDLSDAKEPLLVSPFANDGMTEGNDVTFVRRTPTQTVIEHGPLDSPADRTDAASLPVGDYHVIALRYPYVFVTDAKNATWYANLSDGAVTRLGTVNGVEWESAGGEGRALVCNDFEVAVLDPVTGERDLLTRLGQPLGGCDWSPEGDYVVFSSGGNVSAIEMDARDERNVIPLAKFGSIAGFRVEPESRTLWFAGTVGNSSGIYVRPL